MKPYASAVEFLRSDQGRNRPPCRFTMLGDCLIFMASNGCAHILSEKETATLIVLLASIPEARTTSIVGKWAPELLLPAEEKAP